VDATIALGPAPKEERTDHPDLAALVDACHVVPADPESGVDSPEGSVEALRQRRVYHVSESRG